jgi:uncharacterized membrane protein
MLSLIKNLCRTAGVYATLFIVLLGLLLTFLPHKLFMLAKARKEKKQAAVGGVIINEQ